MRNGKTALISGITGQDGACLSELLLSKGYTVHAIKRRCSSFNTTRPESTPGKLRDSQRLRVTGWRPRIALPAAIAQVFASYQQQVRPCAS